MSTIKNKCSLDNHSTIDAIIYCQECRIFMCNKCEKTHSELCKKHHQYKLDKNLEEIFTGFCKEKNHIAELIYFCKTHNKLCCAECITKIRSDRNGQHTDCEVYLINDIEEEKKNKLQENINNLENLSNTLQESINEIKKIFEKTNENKDNIKLKIQKVFTKIRSKINDREDELLCEVDKKFDNIFFNEHIIKEAEKLPNKIKESLEKGKLINKEWNNNKLNSLINDCLNIENNIKEINIINKSIKKNHSNDIIIKFKPEEKELNNFLENINNFGNIEEKNNKINIDMISKNSKIIDDYDTTEQIIEWIEPKKEIKFNLLFRKSRDGSTGEDFHRFCDNKGATLILIETDKGYKFGGYTPMDWTSIFEDKTDDLTFIFSLNLMKKYNKFKDGYSIRLNKDFGPIFGIGHDFYLYMDMNEGHSENGNFIKNNELTNGEKNYKVKEFEVFQVIIS